MNLLGLKLLSNSVNAIAGEDPKKPAASEGVAAGAAGLLLDMAFSAAGAVEDGVRWLLSPRHAVLTLAPDSEFSSKQIAQTLDEGATAGHAIVESLRANGGDIAALRLSDSAGVNEALEKLGAMEKCAAHLGTDSDFRCRESEARLAVRFLESFQQALESAQAISPHMLEHSADQFTQIKRAITPS